ncbi:hypothetical protein MMC26_005398 [Xylographa opegraphella]|nr:hypothetical protein [Xylographa opegraphella]
MAASKSPNPAGQKKPKRERQVHLPEDVDPVRNGYDDSVCYLASSLDKHTIKQHMRRCNKTHVQMSKPRKPARSSTVIVDLEESGSELERAYAAVEAAKAPKILEPARQKKAKKSRVNHPSEGSKVTVDLVDSCICDLVDSDDSSRKNGWEWCDVRDLLRGIPCKSIRIFERKKAPSSREVVDYEESDTESSMDRDVSVRKFPVSVSGRSINKKEVQGKKRKLEGNISKPDSQGKKRKLEANIPKPDPLRAQRKSEANIPKTDSPGKKRKLEGQNIPKPNPQEKKRKSEAKAAEPGLQGEVAGLTRRHKPSATVAKPPKTFTYDPRTLASDILRAAGKHPTLPPLNWELMKLDAKVKAKASRHAESLGRKLY